MNIWCFVLNEFIVSADKVAELGVKLDPNLAGTEKAKTSKESQIITPEEMKYYKSDALRKGGFTEEEIKNIKANQVKLKSIQQNERSTAVRHPLLAQRARLMNCR